MLDLTAPSGCLHSLPHPYSDFQVLSGRCAQGEDTVLNLTLLSFRHVTISQPLKHERRDKKRLVPLFFLAGTVSSKLLTAPQ